MKSIVRWFAAAVLSTAALRAEERFSQTLSAAEFAAAGLDQLKPEQLARLDELARSYQARATPKPATVVTTVPAAAASPAAIQPPAAVRSAKPAPPAVEKGRIVGTINGWKAHTVFKLENGEIWTVADFDRYDGPTMTNPAVEIRPSNFGGYWMRIESLPEVRVRLVSDSGTGASR